MKSIFSEQIFEVAMVNAFASHGICNPAKRMKVQGTVNFET